MATTTEVHHLESLAAGLCQDADIRLEVSPSNVWAWDPIRRVILVSRNDLQSKGSEYCAGVLAHEVSHYYISRYLWFSVAFPSFKILRFLLNAIEDPRVNTWIRRRYPGTVPWLRTVADTDMRTPDDTPMPAVMRFGFECAREEWLDWLPAHTLGHVPLEVAQALDETREARRAFAFLLPPANLVPEMPRDELLRTYRERVWPRLSSEAPRTLPTAREQGVRVAVLDSLILAEDRILPVARRLLGEDVERVAALLEADPRTRRAAREALRSRDGEAIRDLTAAAARQPRQERAGEREPRPETRVLGLGLVEAWLDNWRQTHRDSPLADPQGEAAIPFPTRAAADGIPSSSGRPLPVRTPRTRRMPSGDLSTLPPGLRTIPLPVVETPYEVMLRQVAPQINHLARLIEKELRPSRRLRDRRGYPSGYKLDLRRLMTYQADLRGYDKLWVRKTVPARWSVVFSLLVDLSGSMQGEKCHAALAGAILLAETLHRLNVPFLINGFQDVLIPFCTVGEGLTARVRQALAEMPQEVDGNRPIGNNKPSYNDDGPCVQAAAEEVLQLRYDERVLIVISDGVPEGVRSTADDLRQVIADLMGYGPGLQLLGIGLGPDTNHVKDFYPQSIANVPVERLAEEIGAVIRTTLRADSDVGGEGMRGRE